MPALRFRLCLLLLLVAIPGAARFALGGEEYHPLDQFEAEARPDPRIEELRRRMDELIIAQSEILIKEQPGIGERADAALILGLFLLTGRMGTADMAKAIDYFRLASELGCPEADLALANIYTTGLESPVGGIEMDPGKGMAYFEKAAAGGSGEALVALGDIYADGRNVDPDSKKALGYYVDAARRGNAAALSRLEPVMRNAREWEAAKPGRKANFPTDPERIIDKELARRTKGRELLLDRLHSSLYVELNKRVASASGMKRD